MFLRSPACLVLLALLLSSGCRDREITAYRAPKEKAPVTPPAASATNTNDLPPGHPPIGAAAPADSATPPPTMANTAVPTASGDGLKWTAPAAWAVKTGSSMRRGSYAIKGDGGEADLSITAFPGATGGLEANLNRWRGQVGLTPQSPAEVTAAVEKFTANGLDFLVVDYAGNAGGTVTRLIGAIVPYGGNSWFFKLTGPDALVAAQKTAFLDFLKTVKAP